jgi:hypothetical protein
MGPASSHSGGPDGGPAVGPAAASFASAKGGVVRRPGLFGGSQAKGERPRLVGDALTPAPVGAGSSRLGRSPLACDVDVDLNRTGFIGGPIP